METPNSNFPKKVFYLFVFVFLFESVFSQTPNLFISEYSEGSSYNKYIEIFNGTGHEVDLSGYEIWRISNGGSWPEATFSLSGILSNGSVYVICHGSADETILALADTVSGVLSFNGDDAVGLAKNSVLIDAVGTDGEDPGSAWMVSAINNATKDHTLVRNSNVCSPNTNWTVSSTLEWTVLNNNDWSNLGQHTNDCLINGTVNNPVFLPPAGFYFAPVEVEIQCPTSETNIYFTTDGTTPNKKSQKYLLPILISETETIKARAYNSTDSSDVVSSTYAIVNPEAVNSIAELRQKYADSSFFMLQNEVVINAIKSNQKQLFVQDSSAAILLDNPNNLLPECEVGDGLENIIGRLTEVNGMLVFCVISEPQKISPAKLSIELPVLTFSEFNNNPENFEAKLISFQTVAFADSGGVFSAGTNFPVTDATSEARFYTYFEFANYIGKTIPGKTDLTALVIQNEEGYFLVSRDTADFAAMINQTPEITNIDFLPRLPDTTASVIVNARITDDIKIVSAKVFFGPDSLNLSRFVVMETNDNEIYQAEIPPQKAGEYFFKIEAKDNAQAVSYSNWMKLRVTIPPLGIPVSNKASEITDKSFVANWNKVPGAENYLIDVSENRDFENNEKVNPNAVIISEVVEGSAYNKAVEIFNGTGIPVNLDDYFLQRDFDGDNNFRFEVRLSGVLENGKTIVICHPRARDEILKKSKIKSTACSFNGNDQIRLVKNKVVVDIFGRDGNTDFAKDVTYIRYDFVSQSSSVYKPVEWKKMRNDAYEFLGTHTMKKAVPDIFFGNYYRFATGDTNQFTIENLYALSDYYYRVRAQSKYETTQTSNIIKVTTANPPLAYLRAQPDTICEDTLDGAAIWCNLVFTQFVDGILPLPSFHINNAPAGLEIAKTVYNSSTSATLILSFQDVDFDTDFKNATITIDGKELTRNYPLESNSLYLKAKTACVLPEPEYQITNLHVIKDSLTSTSFEIAWTNPPDDSLPSGFLVIVDTAKIKLPVDGVDYKTTTGFNNSFQKTFLLENEICECKIAGCEAATNYHVAVFPYNNSDSLIDYKTDEFAEITVKTLRSLFALPDKPYARLPEELTDSSFIARWDSVPGATSYFIDVATDSLFTADTNNLNSGKQNQTQYKHNGISNSILNNFEVGNITRFYLNQLTQCKYFYRVRAKNNNGVSENSNTVKVVLPEKAIPEIGLLSELRKGKTGNVYKYTGRAVVTFVHDFQRQIYIQDSSAAILIHDTLNIISEEYFEGDVIGNLTGKLNAEKGMLEFIPEVSPGLPEARNQKIDTLFIADFSIIDSAYFEKNEGRLVKIPSLLFEVGDNPVFENKKQYKFNQVFLTGAIINPFRLQFRTSFYNVNYIGTEIPYQFLNITGIFNSSDGAFLTARRLSDFEPGTGGSASDTESSDIIIYSNKNNVYIKNYQYKSINVEIVNLSGILVYSSRFFIPEIKITLNNRGIFIVKVTTETQQKSQKIVIQ